MAKAKEKEEEKKFGELMNELDGCISKMESGELELEESLDLYSTGVKILAQLQEKLDASEVIIKELSGKIEREDEISDSTLSHA